MIKDLLGLTGKRIRDYEVLEIVGRGGMGAVYRAVHTLLREDRAIKVISRSPADDDQFIERFVREARVLARLKDEHLVRLYEFWEDGGELYMALEFLHGESVAQRLKARRRLGVAESVRIARQAALGLKAAHEGNVIHRDISPDNLQLVTRPGGAEIVKVMDFGIAKSAEEVTRELTANVFLGKFEYASPEQCGYGLERGERIDLRSDVYSLGVTLFKMVTGHLPFESETPQGYLMKHATEPPPLAASLAPEAQIPRELDVLLQKMLAKKRGDRPQSMAAVIDELQAVPLSPTAAPEETLAEGAIRTNAPQAASPSPSAVKTASGTTGASFKIGDSFARKYVIKGLLGKGGMGVVYRAVDTILDEPVALKVISARLLGGPDAVERLKREVVVARRVAHPNVCRIFDIGESEDGTHYVSMEFIEGRTLSQTLWDRPMPMADGLPLVRQILDALAAAHSVNVVHRDLKPDNVMVTPSGHAVIMDFGLSLSDDSQRLTQAGYLVGTPHYMAPEQVEGATDPRSDLYALGVILFRMFTGRLPFEAPTVLEVLQAHMRTPPPRPSALNPAMSAEFEAVILKALEKDPAQRFASADDFLAALDPIEPVRTRRTGESGRVSRVPRTTARAPVERAQTVVPPATQIGGPATELVSAGPRAQRGPWLWIAAAGGVAVAVAAGVLVLRPTPVTREIPRVTVTVAPTVASPTPVAVVLPTAALTAVQTEVPTTPPAVVRTRLPTAAVATAPRTPPPVTAAPTVATVPPSTAIPPTVAPATATPPPAVKLNPERGVRTALQEYAAAFSRLDRASVRKIFPTVPDKNFEGLANFKTYKMDIEVAKLTVDLPRVMVETQTRHTFTSFSGKQESRTAKEKMVFIESTGGTWVRVQ